MRFCLAGFFPVRLLYVLSGWFCVPLGVFCLACFRWSRAPYTCSGLGALFRRGAVIRVHNVHPIYAGDGLVGLGACLRTSVQASTAIFFFGGGGRLELSHIAQISDLRLLHDLL